MITFNCSKNGDGGQVIILQRNCAKVNSLSLYHFIYMFVYLDALHPSQQFFSYVGMFSCLLGLN